MTAKSINVNILCAIACGSNKYLRYVIYGKIGRFCSVYDRLFKSFSVIDTATMKNLHEESSLAMLVDKNGKKEVIVMGAGVSGAWPKKMTNRAAVEEFSNVIASTFQYYEHMNKEEIEIITKEISQ